VTGTGIAVDGLTKRFRLSGRERVVALENIISDLLLSSDPPAELADVAS
jgi:hypothetical protein